jgi:anti-sigma B factor antagonist
MDISTIPHPGGVTEVSVSGRLNMVTATRVREAIQAAVDDHHARIAVNLEGVVFLDSSGLGALIAGMKAAREAGGDVRLVRPAEQVELVLELTNMAGVLRSFDSVQSAYADA